MKRWSIVVLALFLGIAAGSYWTNSVIHGQESPQAARALANTKELTSYRDLVKQTLPAVVSIETKAKVSKVKATPKKGPIDPRVPEEFRRFFENFEEAPPTPHGGFGSGFFIDAKGVVLTNAHVVEGTDQVTVTLHDGRKFNSRDIKADPKTDLAIIILDAKGPFPYLELADSSAYEIGDRVLAIGAPFGLTGTVTHGIVSAKGRQNLRMNMYEDFIQTDAAINPGNSGGPLIGLEGKVIGINSAIKSRSGGFQGVGLAVASNMAKSVVRALQTDGVVRRGYLGVQIRDLAPEVAERFGLAKGAGVVVGDVFENTPASKAGLQAGDIITGIDGGVIKDPRVLQTTVAGLPLGKDAKFNVYRDGKQIAVTVKVEEQPKEFGRADVPAPRRPVASTAHVKVEKLAVEVAELTPELTEEFGYRKGTTGVVVMEVASDSPAAEAGLRKGMLIGRVDSTRVTTARQMVDAVAAASLERGVLLQVHSPTGGVNFVMVRTGQASS